jgi:hypothetical protein
MVHVLRGNFFASHVEKLGGGLASPLGKSGGLLGFISSVMILFEFLLDISVFKYFYIFNVVFPFFIEREFLTAAVQTLLSWLFRWQTFVLVLRKAVLVLHYTRETLDKTLRCSFIDISAGESMSHPL